MSNQFLKLRRSAVPGKIPDTGSLDLGEIALNTYDGVAFMKKSVGGTESIVTIGNTTGSFTGSFSGEFTGSLLGTASWAYNAVTASTADDFYVRGDITGSNALITGTLTAQRLVVQTISSSVIYSSGSNIFGDELTDTQQFTGSVTITGSLTVNGPSTFNGQTTANNLTGSLFGTSSWATNAVTASHAVTALTASYAISSSNASTASFALGGNGTFSGSFSGSFFGNGAGITNISASSVVGLNLSLISSGSVTASTDPAYGFRVNANSQFSGSTQITGSLGVTGSVSISGSIGNIFSANVDTMVFTGSLYQTGSTFITGTLSVFGGITGSLFGTSSWAVSASHAPSALTASYAISSSYSFNSTTASHALTASSADNFLVRQDVTASNALITGTLTAQTIIAQYITSSTEFITGSTKFGTQLTDTHQFTGSVTITGSLSLNNDPVVTQGPYNTFSQSIQLRATNLESTASILTSASASFAQDSGSNSIRLTNLESTASVLTTASASFAIMSASYASASGSLSTRVTTLENASASFAQDSGSNSVRLTNLESTASVLTQASASFSSSISYLSSSFTAFSQSYNTGSFTGSFFGQAALTGSFSGSFSGTLSGSFSGSVANIDGQTNYIAKFDSPNSIDSSVIYQSSSFIAINETNFTAGDPEALYVFQTHPTSFNVVTGKGNTNNYLQLNIQNTNQGISASSDIVATANNGNEFSNYIDMGINSENFNTGFIGEANDAYVYSIANNLHIGNAATNGSHLGFFVGGDDVQANNKLQLNPDNIHFMSGSLQLTGSLNVLEGITGSLFGTASWAISASHAPTALTSSYAITASYSLTATSASHAINSDIAISASYAATASSANDFLVRQNITASNALITGTLTAQTIIAQYITSSTEFITGSTKFGTQLTDTHQFTGSVTITGSLSLNNDPVVTQTPYNTFSQSIQLRATNLESTASVLTSASASFAQDSGSNSIRFTNLESTASVLTTASASFAIVSASYSSASGSLSTRVTNLESTASVLTLASASFAVVSGSYSSASSSLSIRTTDLESTSSVLTSASASFAQQSGSNSIRFTNLESTASVLTQASASFALVSSSYAAFSSSYNTGSFTGSFTGAGNLTGSLFGTSSWAQNATTASHAVTALSSSYAISSSYSLTATTASHALTTVSASYAATASSADNFLVRQDVTASNALITGTLTAQTIIAQYITSSTEFITGSTKFGSQLTDTHQFTGSVSITGSLTATSPVKLTGLTNTNQVNIVGYDTTTGQLYYQATSSLVSATSSYALTASVAISSSYAQSASFAQSAFDILVYVKNSSGAQINKGSVVRIVGAVGDNPLIATASYTDDNNSANTLGITYQDIPNDDFGYVITEGTLKGIDTSTPGWTAGQLLYLGLNGTITGSAPVAPLHAVRLGEVLRVQLNNGSMYVRIDNGYELGELHDVRDTTTTGSYGDLLVKSGSIWINSRQLTGSYGLTGSLSATSFTGSLFGTASYAINADFLDGKDSSVFATTGSNVFVGDQTVTGSLFTSGSNTLVGSTTLTGSLNVTGSTIQTGNNTLIGNTTLSGSIIISGSSGPGSPTASVQIYGDIRQAGYHRFDPVTTNINNSISASYIYVSGSTNDLYFSQNGAGYGNTTRLRWLEGNLYTGLLNGGLITSQSSTTYQVGSGSGIIVNLNASLNDNPYPTTTYVNWPNLTGNINQFSASFDQTFIAISTAGTLISQSSAFLNGQVDTQIPVGSVLHQNNSTINGTVTEPSLAYGWKQRSNVFINAFGPLKLSGFNLAVSGSSTGSLIVGSGTAFLDGGNYQTDPNNPSYVTATGTSTSRIFRYYESGSGWTYDTNGGVGFGAIDPARYSNNGTLTSVGAGNWSIQRVFFFPTSPLSPKPIIVYYGNAIYATEAEAIANVPFESFTEAPSTAATAIYLGAIVISGNGVFTNASTFTIYPGGLFRQVGGSGGGGSIVTQTLAGLSDVNISGPTNYQALVYDTTQLKWINASFVSASISGNAASATTASFAVTASYILNAVSASYALSASSAEQANTASYVLQAVSASFATTASFASQASTASYVLQAVSASFASNASTASYVLNAVSASYALNATTASHALTASSADNFLIRQNVTASNALITGTLTAQTIIAQYITSSTEFITGSTKFGTLLTDTHQFTGSVTITGSLSLNNSPVVTDAIFTPFSSSVSTRTTNLESTASVLTTASASFAQQSGSNSIRLTNLETTASVLTTASASFALVSASYSSASGSLSTRVTNLETTSSVLTTASASFAIVSSSFATTSASLSTRTTNLESTASILTTASASFAIVSSSYASASGSLSTRVTTLENASASFAQQSGSNSIRLTNLETTASVLTVASASFAIVSASYSALSGSFRTGSYTGSFNGTLFGTASWANNAVTSSYVLNAISASYAATASSADNFLIRQNATASNLLVNNTITAQTLIVQTVTSSIVYSSGSNIFGNQLTDVQQFTGSLRVTGSGNHWIMGGNVGFGTMSPTEKVHLIGNIKAEQTTNNDAYITLNANSSALASSYQWNLVGSNSTQNYGFQIREASTAYVHVNNSAGGNAGYVGINKTSPVYRLDVAGDGNFTANLTATGSIRFPSLSNANQVNVVGYNTATGQLFYQTTSSLNVTTASYALTSSNVLGGSTNYISKWATPTSLNSSNIYQDPTTGGIGIGITTVYNKFAIGQPDGIPNTNVIGFNPSYVNGRNGIDSYTNNPTGSAGLDFFADDYKFKIGTSDRVIIDNGGSLTVIGNMATTGSLVASGSVRFPGLTNVNQTNIVSYNTTTGQLFYQTTSSLSVATASYALTASHGPSGFTIGITQIKTATINSSIVGSNNLFTDFTGSFSGAKYLYTVSNGSNARTGEVMAVWNGGSVQYTDNSTLDIGSTTAVTASVSIVGTDALFNMQTNTSGWRIKSQVTYI